MRSVPFHHCLEAAGAATHAPVSLTECEIMVEPTQHSVDHDVEASMRLFERAHVGEVSAVEPRQPARVLLALDGSDQDALGVALSRGLRERFGCAVSVMDARERRDSADLASQAARAIGGEWLPPRTGESFEQILAAAAETRSDLVVVPSPFGRDLESVGPDSTGTVVDVLLARMPAPLMVVRRPYVPAGELFANVIFTLSGENEAAGTAGTWAAGLTAPGGRLRLVLVMEAEFAQNVRAVMQTVDPHVQVTEALLTDALARMHVRLHRGLQKSADHAGFQYELRIEPAGGAAEAALYGETGQPLLVIAHERGDHFSQGLVHDRIRLSPNPVLVVPAS
jgi:hypothetical protein